MKQTVRSKSGDHNNVRSLKVSTIDPVHDPDWTRNTMTKTKQPLKAAEKSVASKTGSKKRLRPEVQVVACPSAFPISARNPQRATQQRRSEQRGYEKAAKKNDDKNLLDFHQTAHEIRHFGATGFEGKQKKDYQAEQYELLTGRKKKNHQVPLPIVRGIRKKAAQRQARALQEAKEAGIVLPKQAKKQKQRNDVSRVHGPAPSIGFTKRGVLKIKGKPE